MQNQKKNQKYNYKKKNNLKFKKRRNWKYKKTTKSYSFYVLHNRCSYTDNKKISH